MRFTLYRQDVRLARAIRASVELHAHRSRLFVEIEHDGVAGYGEVAPQPRALHGDPSLDQVIAAARVIGANLRRSARDEESLPSWRHVHRLSSGQPAERVAYALTEMALLDRSLRLGRDELATLWPLRFDTPRQGTVSLLENAAWSFKGGVDRLRAKIAPGPLDPRAIERLVEVRVPVLLDYNCSATDDEQVLTQVGQLRDVLDVVGVEQPYAVGNLIDHARLAARLGLPLSLDESVRSTLDLRHVANYRAASWVCVKPARVGGLANARSLFELARELGLRAYLGGFFESPFARGVHRRFARAWVDEPSDLDDVTLAEESEPIERGGGFGIEPSRTFLARAEALPA